MKHKHLVLLICSYLFCHPLFAQQLKLITELKTKATHETLNNIHPLSNNNGFIFSYVTKFGLNPDRDIIYISKQNDIVKIPGKNKQTYFQLDDYLYQIILDKDFKFNLLKTNIKDTTEKTFTYKSITPMTDLTKENPDWYRVDQIRIFNNKVIINYFNRMWIFDLTTLTTKEYTPKAFPDINIDYKDAEPDHLEKFYEFEPFDNLDHVLSFSMFRYFRLWSYIASVNGDYYYSKKTSKYNSSTKSVNHIDWFVSVNNSKGDLVDSIKLTINTQHPIIRQKYGNLNNLDYTYSYLYFDDQNQYFYTKTICKSVKKMYYMYIQKFDLKGNLLWDNSIPLITNGFNYDSERLVFSDKFIFGMDNTLMSSIYFFNGSFNNKKGDNIHPLINADNGKLVSTRNAKKITGIDSNPYEKLTVPISNLLNSNKKLSLAGLTMKSCVVRVSENDYFIILKSKKSYFIYRYN